MSDYKTIIVIGRQFGSGGKSVAVEIGRRLSIPVYDNELIKKAAEDSGFDPELFEKVDERRNFLSLPGFVDGGRYGISENYVDREGLFKIQSQVISDIAEKRSAIFVGRCSDYVLRDKKPLSVFITSPMEERIARVAKREDISPEAAATLIRKKDKARQSYYDFYTLGNWGLAENYDICINSALLGTEKTAECIIDFGKKAGRIQ